MNGIKPVDYAQTVYVTNGNKDYKIAFSGKQDSFEYNLDGTKKKEEEGFFAKIKNKISALFKKDTKLQEKKLEEQKQAIFCDFDSIPEIENRNALFFDFDNMPPIGKKKPEAKILHFNDFRNITAEPIAEITNEIPISEGLKKKLNKIEEIISAGKIEEITAEDGKIIALTANGISLNKQGKSILLEISQNNNGEKNLGIRYLDRSSNSGASVDITDKGNIKSFFTAGKCDNKEIASMSKEAIELASKEFEDNFDFEEADRILQYYPF